jgi:hypothetical protein
MNLHPFAYVMIATFMGAIVAMGLGAGTLTQRDGGASTRGNSLMMLRVGLCFALLVEIIIYISYFKA